MAKIVLASGSPRRQELLNRIGITDFDIRVPEAEESYPEGLTPQQVVEYLSRKKADAAMALCSGDEIVITADTMVFLDDQRLGKPADEADALRMLTSLQGRHHTVCTGVTVRQGDRSITQCETTEVYFRTAMTYSDGSLLPFLTRPISLLFLIIIVVTVSMPLIKKARATKKV